MKSTGDERLYQSSGGIHGHTDSKWIGHVSEEVISPLNEDHHENKNENDRGTRNQGEIEERDIDNPAAKIMRRIVVDEVVVSALSTTASAEIRDRAGTPGLIGNSIIYFQHFFDMMFKDDIPLPILLMKNVPQEELNKYDVPGCIMSNAADTMSMTLTDFDPAYYAKAILATSRSVPDQRGKTFHATVRGMGGGKTRGFEEIRRELLLEEGVLTIAITFNSSWEISKQLDKWNNIVGEEDYVGAYTLSMVSRM
eukprot:gene14440-30725_t